MLENKNRLDQISPAYHYVGNENGHDVFIVDIKESKTQKKKINIDDALLDDDFTDEYCNCTWKDDPPKDENKLDQTDFYRMDYKDIQYYIYRQLVNISSLLSDIKDVVSDGNKS